MHGRRKRAPKENTSSPISLRASRSQPQSQAPRSVTVSTARTSPCSTLTPSFKDDEPSTCESSKERGTAGGEDFDGVLKRIINDERYSGDGGDSDVDGDEYDIHRDCIVSESDKSNSAHDDVDAKDTKGKSIGFVDLTNEGSTQVVGKVHMVRDEDSKIVMDDAKKHIKIHSTPPEWKAPAHAPLRGEPKWNNVDNPGDWPQYCFAPVFTDRKKNSKYLHHALPTGARPVPKNKKGDRICNEWKFHYKGWKNDTMPYRNGATTSNLFPKDMNGSLDLYVLKSLGLSETRIVDCDAFFSIS